MDQRLTQKTQQQVIDENREKRARAESALKFNPNRMNKEIAEVAGVSESMALRVRSELEAKGSIPVWRMLSSGVVIDRKILVKKTDGARDALREDPKRSNRLIAELTGAHHDTIRQLRKELELAGQIPVIPVNERMNAGAYAGRGQGPGATVEVPDGSSVMDLAVKGIEIEDNNPDMTQEDLAELVGLSPKIYRYVRAIHLLSIREGLRKEDLEIVKDVITQIEKTKQISRYWSRIQPISDKVWGPTTKGGPDRRKSETKRKKLFDHSIGLIVDMCSRGPEVDIPFLAEREQLDALRKVNEAINCLKQLNVNIRRARG